MTQLWLSVLRKFKPEWLVRFPWLAYSKYVDGAFCLPCVCFGMECGKNGSRLDKLFRGGKEKGYETINRWRKACVRHYYWSVTSSEQHLGEVKYAKFETFLYHIVNEHNNLHVFVYKIKICLHCRIFGVWKIVWSFAKEKASQSNKEVFLIWSNKCLGRIPFCD